MKFIAALCGVLLSLEPFGPGSGRRMPTVTEAQWLASSDAICLLDYAPVSDRKLHLILAACCRRIWPTLGQESREEVGWHERLANQPGCPKASEALQRDVEWEIAAEVPRVLRAIAAPPHGTPGEGAAHAALVREVVGNPFRPSAPSTAWLTPEVTALAQAADGQRQLPSGLLDPARIAILADALEDAGCTSADVLGHLRGSGPHVRGCWVVDVLLGKG